MANCEICDTVRMNGTPIQKSDSGWRLVTDPNPSGENIFFACRDCAVKKLGKA